MWGIRGGGGGAMRSHSQGGSHTHTRAQLGGTPNGTAVPQGGPRRFSFLFAIEDRSRYHRSAVGCPPTAVGYPPTVELRLTDSSCSFCFYFAYVLFYFIIILFYFYLFIFIYYFYFFRFIYFHFLCCVSVRPTLTYTAASLSMCPAASALLRSH